MRKIKIALKRGTKHWSFILYDSAESAFFLREEEMLEDEDEYRKLITLKRGESIEIEWMGSEWIYLGDMHRKESPKSSENSRYEKYDKVRIGKLAPIKTKAGSQAATVIEVYTGWLLGDVVVWSQKKEIQGIKISEINSKSSKVDFNKLFLDIDDDEINEMKQTKQIKNEVNQDELN